MTPLEMIAEWRKGCTCGGPMFDRIENNPPGTTSPAECVECTVGLIEAMESWHQRARGPWYIRAPMAVLSWILERMPRPAPPNGAAVAVIPCLHANRSRLVWGEDGWTARCRDCGAIGYFGDDSIAGEQALVWRLNGYAIGGSIPPSLRSSPFDRLPTEFVMSSRANFVLSSGDKDFLRDDAGNRRYWPLG
jgi:hypothetical protein